MSFPYHFPSTLSVPKNCNNLLPRWQGKGPLENRVRMPHGAHATFGNAFPLPVFRRIGTLATLTPEAKEGSEVMTKEEFGKRLHKIMAERGLHHHELARLADLPRNNISTYINGRCFPTEQSLAKLAKALGVTPDEILPNHPAIGIRSHPTMSPREMVRELARQIIEILEDEA